MIKKSGVCLQPALAKLQQEVRQVYIVRLGRIEDFARTPQEELIRASNLWQRSRSSDIKFQNKVKSSKESRGLP